MIVTQQGLNSGGENDIPWKINVTNFKGQVGNGLYDLELQELLVIRESETLY